MVCSAQNIIIVIRYSLRRPGGTIQDTHNNYLRGGRESWMPVRRGWSTSLYLRSCLLFLLAKRPVQPMSAVWVGYREQWLCIGNPTGSTQPRWGAMLPCYQLLPISIYYLQHICFNSKQSCGLLCVIPSTYFYKYYYSWSSKYSNKVILVIIKCILHLIS